MGQVLDQPEVLLEEVAQLHWPWPRVTQEDQGHEKSFSWESRKVPRKREVSGVLGQGENGTGGK